MCLDRGLQNLCRQHHEPILDGADKQMGMLDQPSRFSNGCLPGFRLTAKSGGKVFYALSDHVNPHRLINNHMRPAKQRGIVIGAANAGEIKIGWRFKIMSGAGGGKWQIGAAQIERPLKARPTKQHIYPVQWPYPAKRGGTPALTFRPREICQNVTDHRWQERSGCRPLHLGPGEQKGSFWRFFGDKLVSGEAC